MDVASYVKYNARLVEATRAHTAAMRHVHTLWSLVLRSDEEFLRRSHRLAETIDKDVRSLLSLGLCLVVVFFRGREVVGW